MRLRRHHHQASMGTGSAVSQGRADWGVAIRGVADPLKLGFLPLTEERYDFAVPKARAERPAVRALRQLLTGEDVKQKLTSMGFIMT